MGLKETIKDFQDKMGVAVVNPDLPQTSEMEDLVKAEYLDLFEKVGRTGLIGFLKDLTKERPTIDHNGWPDVSKPFYGYRPDEYGNVWSFSFARPRLLGDGEWTDFQIVFGKLDPTTIGYERHFTEAVIIRGERSGDIRLENASADYYLGNFEGVNLDWAGKFIAESVLLNPIPGDKIEEKLYPVREKPREYHD